MREREQYIMRITMKELDIISSWRVNLSYCTVSTDVANVYYMLLLYNVQAIFSFQKLIQNFVCNTIPNYQTEAGNIFHVFVNVKMRI